MNKKSNRFSPEMRERAVRMVQEHRGEYPSLWAAIESIAPKVGCVPPTLLEWVKKAEVDSGQRDGVTSSERDSGLHGARESCGTSHRQQDAGDCQVQGGGGCQSQWHRAQANLRQRRPNAWVMQTGSRKAVDNRAKLYSWHAPEVECISKGKSRNPYEFGVKVGLAMTLKGNLIVGARSFPGNPYDGHTMHEQIEQSAILMQGLGVKPEVVYADLGYRGVDKDNPDIEIKHRGKDKRLTDEERRLLKRRQAIEPIIGHLKADHRMDSCHLKGSNGDALHAVLCAAGYNIRWLLRMIVKKGLGLLLCLLQASGLAGLFGKLAEIFCLNRLQNSDQRWVLV